MGTVSLSSLVFVPIPPSKARDDPLYDDRVTRMLRAIGPAGTVDVRELIIQTKSTDAVHSRQLRPTPSQIQNQYHLDDTLSIPEPAFIALVDDVLTTGAHFRAASTVLTARLSNDTNRRAVHRTESTRRRLTSPWIAEVALTERERRPEPGAGSLPISSPIVQCHPAPPVPLTSPQLLRRF